jgi:hypothetical protein
MTRVEELLARFRELALDEQDEFRTRIGELPDEWQEVVRRRDTELEDGDVKGVAWEDVRARLRERISAHPD